MYIHKTCVYICFKRIYFIDYLKFWQMNNLKKILQQVLDYYNEVGCIRLLKILFILCITTHVFVEWLKLKINTSTKQLSYGAQIT